MTPLQWLTLFAQFIGLLPEMVDRFADEHPDLRDPPPPPAEDSLHDAALASVAAQFDDD